MAQQVSNIGLHVHVLCIHVLSCIIVLIMLLKLLVLFGLEYDDHINVIIMFISKATGAELLRDFC